MLKLKMHRYFKMNSEIAHVEQYVLHCSIGDWFVLYQMSRNLNRRFFADFLIALSKTVNPNPDLECSDSDHTSNGKNHLKKFLEKKNAREKDILGLF